MKLNKKYQHQYYNQIKIKDKILANKTKIYIILKQKKNLIMNSILKKEQNQEKVDLVQLKNVKVNKMEIITQLN